MLANLMVRLFGNRMRSYSGAMTHRTGIYIVPTDRWYIERTVWLIAGVVLLSCTVLAVWVNPLWILGVAATGLVSINVAFTGFCPVGNVLYFLGFKPKLGAGGSKRFYFLQTDSWYLERRIYVTVGVNITLASILFLTWSPWWGLFTGFVGAAMVWFASTGYCILANILFWIGAEPRLNPGAVAARPVTDQAKHA
jgi:hypothetical protein